MNEITVDDLVNGKICDSATAEQYVDALNAACEQFGIDTPERQAGFLAQCAHESGHFKLLNEGLNYGAKGLLAIFGKYFNAETAAQYERKPEAIANRVYANRNGNGDEASGDGFKYHGRGLIQLTFKNNYAEFGRAIGREQDMIDQPELVATPPYAALSAAWFWSTHGINALADAGDVEGMTRKVNGGLNGIDDRKAIYASISSVMVA